MNCLFRKETNNSDKVALSESVFIPVSFCCQWKFDKFLSSVEVEPDFVMNGGLTSFCCKWNFDRFLSSVEV